MGSLLCCCCCCDKNSIRVPRRDSSFSDLETIRHKPFDLEILQHSAYQNPFLDMNPVLVESSTRVVSESSDRTGNPLIPVKEANFANAFVFNS